MAVFHNVAAQQFEIEEEGRVAVGQYEREGEILVVTHIIVPVEMRGRGVASEIAREIVAFARREKLEIVPQCSFMRGYLERHPQDGSSNSA